MFLQKISLCFQVLAGITPILFLFQRDFISKRELMVFFISSVLASIFILTTTIYSINNYFVHNSFLIVELICLSIFYFKAINWKYIRVLIIISFVSFLLFFIHEIYRHQVIIDGFKIVNIAYLVLVTILFLNLLQGKYGFKKSLILINASFFIYRCTSFVFIFYLMKIMTENLWYIHNFIEGSSKLLIAYAFWKLPKTSHY